MVDLIAQILALQNNNKISWENWLSSFIFSHIQTNCFMNDHVCYFNINFVGHNLAIILIWNLLSIGLYKINTNVIHLFVLFEHWCCVHCLNTNVMCLFVLFEYICCMFIHVDYTWKSCTQVPCLNNARHLCLNNTNLWNNWHRWQCHGVHSFEYSSMTCNELVLSS